MEKKTLEASRRYFAEGNKVNLKIDVPDQELSSKDVLVLCSDYRNKISQGEQQLEQIKANAKQEVLIQSDIDRVKSELLKLERFEVRMRDLQESRAKALYDDHHKGMIEQIDAGYKWDKSIPDSTNHLQKYQQLQRKISTFPTVAEQLAPSVIQKMFFKECFFDNPWSNE